MRVVRTKLSAGPAREVRLVDDDGGPIEVVCSFLAHLEARGCSPNTCLAYANDLLRFWRFLSEEALSWETFGPCRVRNLRHRTSASSKD